MTRINGARGPPGRRRVVHGARSRAVGCGIHPPNTHRHEKELDMPDYRSMFSSRYLGPHDLPEPRDLEIQEVTRDRVGFQSDEEKLVVRFKGETKTLPLNRINADAICEITGTADFTQWPGHVVQVYATQTEFQGKRVPCTRIRPRHLREAS